MLVAVVGRRRRRGVRACACGGAEITEEPADQDYGERRYAGVDPEGHRWYFGQITREVKPEDWGAEVTTSS